MKYFYLGFLSHLFYEDSPILSIPSPPFSNFVPHSPCSFVALLLWLNRWSHHIWCVIFNDWYYGSTHVMPWYLLMCFVQHGVSLPRSNTWCGFLQVLWFDITYKKRNTTHSGANRLTHPDKYILTSPVMCWQQLSVLHWMNNLLMSRIFFTETHNVFTFQKLLSCRSHISVL